MQTIIALQRNIGRFARRFAWRKLLENWLNRDMPAERQIEIRIGWPLFLIPLVLLNQIFAPHMVWVVFSVTLTGVYVVALLWVLDQTPAVNLTRRRLGTILVAGDVLEEEFDLRNHSRLPLLWAEFLDRSTVPGYMAGRVVACGGGSFYRWRSEVLCRRRGLFRLGPHQLQFQDPFGLFRVKVDDPRREIVIIYPRVVQLPPVRLPHGDTQGSENRRRPLPGTLPAATVSDYRPGDSLRFIHWISTAHRGRLMVKDREIEPSGDTWIVLDLDARQQRTAGEISTLEEAVVASSSLAAELLHSREQRGVGLMAYSGPQDGQNGSEPQQGELVEVVPASGQAQLWSILAALAPVAAGEVDLATLLSSNRSRFGRRTTAVIITPCLQWFVGSHNNWFGEIAHLQSSGVAVSVILVVLPADDAEQVTVLREQLAQANVALTVVTAGEERPALLTFRRRRTVFRSTPTGGAVQYEVEEDVG